MESRACSPPELSRSLMGKLAAGGRAALKRNHALRGSGDGKQIESTAGAIGRQAQARSAVASASRESIDRPAAAALARSLLRKQSCSTVLLGEHKHGIRRKH